MSNDVLICKKPATVGEDYVNCEIRDKDYDGTINFEKNGMIPPLDNCKNDEYVCVDFSRSSSACDVNSSAVTSNNFFKTIIIAIIQQAAKNENGLQLIKPGRNYCGIGLIGRAGQLMVIKKPTNINRAPTIVLEVVAWECCDGDPITAQVTFGNDRVVILIFEGNDANKIRENLGG